MQIHDTYRSTYLESATTELPGDNYSHKHDPTQIARTGFLIGCYRGSLQNTG